MIGQTISHYRIVEELGEGGMGVVYKAQDLKLDRFVAIKVLAPHLSRDKEATARFVHEAKAASALDHSNIGTIHDIDETAEGQTFIVMACYEGETLQERIKRGGVTIEEALGYVSQTAAGLAKAHEKGIVHRDIKPSNIIVTRDGQAKIMDFGLAKLAGGTRLTKTGSSLGTVAYMSPEQAQGREVDERSDIFSLGAVLYELLAGRLPFKGEHEAAVLYEIVHEEPEPLSSARSDIPEALEQIAAKALQKDANARYQRALDMKSAIDELARNLAGAPGGASPSARVRGSGTRPRRWIPLALIALVIAAGAIVLPRIWPSKEPAAKDLSLAVMDFRNLANPADTNTAVAITTLVELSLVQSSPIRPICRDLVYDKRRRLFGSGRGAIADDQVLAIAREVKSTMYLAAQILDTGAERMIAWRLVDTRSGKSIGADKIAGRTLSELADGIVQGVLPLLAGMAGGKSIESPATVSIYATSSEEAYRHYVNGLLAFDRYDDQAAIAELERAVAIDSTFALAIYRLAQAHLSLSLAAEGLPKTYADRAWTLRSHLNNKDRMSLEAFREQVHGDIPAALKTYREILDRWPDDRETLQSLARYLFSFWHPEEAAAVSKRGLELYGDSEIFVTIYEGSLPSLGRSSEALSFSLDYAKSNPQKDHRGHIAQRYFEVGLPDSAEAFNRRQLLDRPGYWHCIRDIAYCYYARGDVDSAIAMLEALLMRSDILKDQRLRILISGWGPGLVELPAEIGRFGRAFEFLREYRKLASASAAARVEGRLLLAKGEADEAVKVAGRALELSTTSLDSIGSRLSLIEAMFAAGAASEGDSLLSEVLKADERSLYAGNRYLALLLRAIAAIEREDSRGALAALRDCEKFIVPSSSAGRFQIKYLETAARAYRISGRFEDAVESLRNLLRIYGGHALSHYELGKIYEEMKRPADAKKEYAKFLEMWSEADEGLPQLIDARKRLAAL